MHARVLRVLEINIYIYTHNDLLNPAKIGDLLSERKEKELNKLIISIAIENLKFSASLYMMKKNV